MTTKPQFRTGPHMGIPYEQALALGLSSALKGREAYDQFVSRCKVSTPSQRLLHREPFKWDSEAQKVATITACYGAKVDPELLHPAARMDTFHFLMEPLGFAEAELVRDYVAEGVDAMRRLQGKLRLLEEAMAAEMAHQEHRKGARRA